MSELKLRSPKDKEGEQTQPRREKQEESFLPVEITGAWVRAEKGIGGRIVLGWFAPGLKPRPPEERRRRKIRTLKTEGCGTRGKEKEKEREKSGPTR
jgi:hypothetical protein